jgi:MSHA biogenesis protein MshJ
MKAYWQTLSDRYAALKPREKQLIAVATLVAVGFIGFSLIVDPPSQRGTTLRKQMEQQRAELATLQAQVATLQSQRTDPDAANKQAMAETRAALTTTDERLFRLDGTLVPPERIGQLLKAVLVKHRGLSLVSLRTLPPVPLIKPPVVKTEGKRGEPPPPPPPADNLYKHGLEIRITGSFGDLLAYVAELENAPQRLLWDRLSLQVIAHPRNELTLTVYTLSRHPDWLVV